jgi:hypothetical protein
MVMLNAQNAQSEDDFAGNARPLPGRYHAAVNHAEEKGSKKKGTPGLDIEFQVIVDGLAPDGKIRTSGQGGRTIPLFLSYIGGDDNKTQTCINRVTRLALCCGVLQPGQAKEPDWNDAIGRELVIEVERQQEEVEEDDGKGGKKRIWVDTKFVQVGFMGFWSLGNKEVANVPKDTTSPGMQQLAKSGGNGAKPATQAASTTAAPAASGKPRGKWDSI